MVRYRRSRVPGGTYFFTVALADRCSDLLVRHIGLVREAFRAVRRQRPFHVEAIVILPEHLHAVWTLPAGDADYPGRWRAIKAHVSRRLKEVQPERNARGESALWQRRYWEHTITDGLDLARHVDYIHFNPVKHGLVAKPGDWPHSSFHRYVRAGLLPADWGGVAQDGERGYGEPP